MTGEEEVRAAGLNVPAPDLNGPQVADSLNFMDKYAAERSKRLKGNAASQYIDLAYSDKYRSFIDDPWVESGTTVNTPVEEGGRTKFVIAGAGFGGILFAIRLIEAGFKASDLVIVDPAGGFGGTWYWNRYPGLMCDVESYIYLPLLEETGYIPKRRYASGHEIRTYCEKLCAKYGLHERAMFQSAVQSLTWDETSKDWEVKVQMKPKGGEKSVRQFRADFAIVVPGILGNAKLPDIAGFDSFKGHMFHTARWDYNYTGGTPDSPNLTGLKGKKVALIGSGATAVQACPELAKYADELFIFQRTPSAIDERGNHDTDPDTFKSTVATHKGWYKDRNLNFAAFVENAASKPEQNMVDDAWTAMPSYSALLGTPQQVTMEKIGEHIQSLHALDYPRQERIRQRAKAVVEDSSTAESLQAWYPGWCKRPCFHDEYLQMFNKPNVHLVDTAGKGIDRVVERGIEFDGQVYDVDLIIWSTGFRSPVLGSSAGKANLTVTGRNGASMEELNATQDMQTLHGMSFRQFPNFYSPGPSQAAATANYTFVLSTLAAHIAFIVATATSKAAEGQKTVLEPTQEAVDEWQMVIMSGAVKLAGMGGCTPSYFNLEGEVDKITDPAARMNMAKRGVWGHGFTSFGEMLEGWREEGGMKGLEVKYV